ncbi:hypothetical protein GPALN_003234 [Globodera pallida]|nr:hypothetical protein GPALN_003234 [Globodera pallida]
MSDNASESEQKQQMQAILICDDVWLGVFAFVSPFELGLKMALISDRLDVLVDVHFKSRHWGLFPEFTADDNAGASSNQAVAKCLLIPRGDGLPKLFYYDDRSEKIGGIKGLFLKASEPANFIIRLRSSRFEPFELTNNLTGERLTFRRIDKSRSWLLVRCPIGREEDKWTNWEKEAVGRKWHPQGKPISIAFEDRDIGDG